MNAPVSRVVATPAALDLIARLEAQHGPVMFHQSGGCCDGSVPLCFPRDEFRIGAHDVLLGLIDGGRPLWVGDVQYDIWRDSLVTLDAVPGRAAGMSLEGGEGERFVTLATALDAEQREQVGEPLRGEAALAMVAAHGASAVE